MQHRPVMVEEACNGLIRDPSGVYLDATFGRGGHTRSLLSKLDKKALVYVLDRDHTAYCAAKRLAWCDRRVIPLAGAFSSISNKHGPFSDLRFDGVLFDVGVSSPQLDDDQRGFSFLKDGPLDMRMDSSTGSTAAEWLNSATESELATVFFEYGEETRAKQIAKSVIDHRPITTTIEFAQLISNTLGRRRGKRHPATRIFQAVRIFVNDELNELKAGLEATFDLLNPNGRIVVISFHSLEHRIVKHFVPSINTSLPQGIPISNVELKARFVGRRAVPTFLEVRENPRARSAQMRIIERVS